MDSIESSNQAVDVIYKAKAAKFNGRDVVIILQDDNCGSPLVAICNVLLLRNEIKLDPDTPEVPLSTLKQLVEEKLLDLEEPDGIEPLRNLATGLDIDIRFRDIHDFVPANECIVFGMLKISLVHGWLYDPKHERTSTIIGDKSLKTLKKRLMEGLPSYPSDQLKHRGDEEEQLEPEQDKHLTMDEYHSAEADVAIDLSSQFEDDLDPEGVIISSFLEERGSEVTPYGLICLKERLQEEQLCIFFRKNHFSTMFKYDGQLYILVTDLACLNKRELVWKEVNGIRTSLPVQEGKNSGDQLNDQRIQLVQDIGSTYTSMPIPKSKCKCVIL